MIYSASLSSGSPLSLLQRFAMASVAFSVRNLSDRAKIIGLNQYGETKGDIPESCKPRLADLPITVCEYIVAVYRDRVAVVVQAINKGESAYERKHNVRH